MQSSAGVFELIKKNKSLVDEAASLRKQKESLEQENENLKAEVSELTSSIESLLANKDHLTLENEIIQNKSLDNQEGLFETIQSLETAVSKKETEIEFLKGNYSALDKDFKESIAVDQFHLEKDKEAFANSREVLKQLNHNLLMVNQTKTALAQDQKKLNKAQQQFDKAKEEFEREKQQSALEKHRAELAKKYPTANSTKQRKILNKQLVDKVSELTLQVENFKEQTDLLARELITLKQEPSKDKKEVSQESAQQIQLGLTVEIAKKIAIHTTLASEEKTLQSLNEPVLPSKIPVVTYSPAKSGIFKSTSSPNLSSTVLVPTASPQPLSPKYK